MISPSPSLKNKIIRLFFLSVISLVVISFIAYYFYYSASKKSRASFETVLIDSQNTNQASTFVKQKNISSFSLYGKDKIYSLNSNQASLGMVAFINSDIQLKQDNTVKTILPKSVNQGLFLVKKLSENQDQLNGTHFFYQQKISNLPVYGAFVNMHLNRNDQLYGLQGSVLENESIPMAGITEDQAKAIALDKAKQEAENPALEIIKSEKLILNKKILGISNDDKNYLVLAVTVGQKNISEKPFARKYFVDLASREIVYEENLVHESMARYIYDYRYASNGSIPQIRGEGDPPTNDADIDNTYDILGETYNFYLTNFNRRSYDNFDSPFQAVVHINSETDCPNAFWDSVTKAIYICNGMVGKDVIGHEITHGVNYNLLYAFQAGALAESLSDAMAVGLDRNWTMGESTILGILRYIDDPPRSPRPQPDRLFSDLYRCADTSSESNDNGYVHFNSGVINKAFYLMVQGGSFNGCQMTGIGMEKALAIIYRYMTIYTTPTENFKNTYNSILRSCSDLHQESSDTCTNVKKALQAVEIDQQPDNRQNGAKCLNVTRQTPICALISSPTPTSAAEPTVTPIPTSVIPTPTINPNCQCVNDVCKVDCSFDYHNQVTSYTVPPKCNLPTSFFSTPPTGEEKRGWCKPLRVKGDANGDGIVNNFDYYYYIAVVFGGKIPPNVNPDFSGDGEVGRADLDIFNIH